VGETAHWVPGLDVLGALTGISAIVVPHYNNAEGGGHDTRYCYLGEQRLTLLEGQLPDGTGILGVDEHTALLIDLSTRSASVAGNGVVTVRSMDSSREFGAGSTLALDELAGLLSGAASEPGGTGPAPAGPGGHDVSAPSVAQLAADRRPVTAVTLRGVAEEQRAAFDAALGARDIDGCVVAVLALEEAIVEWSRDSLQSADTTFARRVLRALVVRLGEVAVVGARDPRDAVAPLVDMLVELRARARDRKDFATSDRVRDRLAAAGVELRDTGNGADWDVR